MPELGLKLPVAFLRFWPGDGDYRWALTIAEKLARIPGIARLEEGLFAALPTARHGNVFETSIRLGGRLLARLLRGGTGREISGILIFPGEIVVRGRHLEAVDETLLADLDKKAPHLPPQGLFLTGYSTSSLKQRYRFEGVDLYNAPSGRRFQFFRLLGEKRPSTHPWHNPELLGRTVEEIPRPEATSAFAARIEEAGATPDRSAGVLLQGPLGCGKTRLAHRVLDRLGVPFLWSDAGYALPGSGELARHLLDGLFRIAPRALPVATGELRRPETLENSRAIDLIVRALRKAREQLGTSPWLVCDPVDSLGTIDHELLGFLLEDASLRRLCRILLISRPGLGDEVPRDDLLPLDLSPLTEEESNAHRHQLLAGLGFDTGTEAILGEAARGIPLALEEGLLAFLHQGLIRRVYGSYFFDGQTGTGFSPSASWIRYVEAEAHRLGSPLPLRLLAAAKLTVPAEQLVLACADLGRKLTPSWEEPYIAAGWLGSTPSAWGTGLSFTSEALRSAFSATLPVESIAALRHALGRVMAGDASSPASDWQAYRLLAGSPEALPSLLDFSRDSLDASTREELFEALINEYRLLRQRGGDPEVEIRLLWSMLPMSRHLGRLQELEKDLDHAIELTAGTDPRRHSAFLTLRADLDLEKARFREAEARLRQALIASEGSDERHRAKIFIRLGDLLMRRERWDEAREMFAALLTVVEQRGHQELIATSHFYLGNVALAQRQLADAFEHHQEALRIRRELGLQSSLGASFSALGAVSLVLGDYAKALLFYREAEKALADVKGRREELSIARRGSGRALNHLGNYSGAATSLRQALEISDGHDVVNEASARLDIANNLLDLGHVEDALEEARQAHFQLSLIPEITVLGDAERMLGQILLARRQWEECHQTFENALRIHRCHQDRHAEAIDISWLLELALIQGDRESILHRGMQLDELLSELTFPDRGERLFFRLYKAFWWLEQKQLKVPDPIEYLRKAKEELVRKTGFLEPDQRHVYLFQIQEHEEMLEAAAKHDLSMLEI